MTGIKDLLASERGCFAIFVTLICTAMLVIGKMTVDQWMDYTKWIAIALIAGKTVTTALDTLRPQQQRIPVATVVKDETKP